MMQLSATVITLNEEKNIADCLASLDFADEIVVVDSGSSDRTAEICRGYPKVRFIHNEWSGYGRQKNFAAELAVNNWILNIDADERVSPQLHRSLEQADRNSFSAARMARENYFGKRWIRHCGWYPDYTTRFYDRRRCRFSERLVHEALEHDGTVATLDGNLRHFTYDGIGDYLRRMDRYSSLAAEEKVREGYRPKPLDLIAGPLFTFLRMFLLKKGFLEGEAGLILSSLYAIYTFCKYAKAREILQAREHDLGL
ncbi:MAG: glycosyltransferase family 2 protein [Desulfuromonadales bacterium]